MAATRRKVEHVVADSGAFIRNAPLRDIGVQIYTLPSVVAEIKDKATKQRLQFLPYRLEYREPTPEAVKIVTEFSKKTGDYPSLSVTDIQVLALAYHLEKEYVGTDHIKTSPDTTIEINLSTPAPSEPTQIAGFYLGTQKPSHSRTTSERVNSESSDSIDGVTSALEQQKLTDSHSDGGGTSCTSSKQDASDKLPAEQNSNKQNDEKIDSESGQDLPIRMKVKDSGAPRKNQDNKLPSGKERPQPGSSSTAKIYSEVRDLSSAGGHVNKLKDKDEFPSLSHDQDNKLSSGKERPQPGSSSTARIYSEVRDVSSAECHMNKLEDEDEFPSLSHDHDVGDKEISTWTVPKQVYVEIRDSVGDSHSNNLFADESEFPSLSSAAGRIAPVWGVSHVPVIEDTSSAEDKNLEDEYPALSEESHKCFSLTGEPDQIDTGLNLGYKTSTKMETSPVSGQKPFSYAKITREGQQKEQKIPEVKRVFHEGQVLPSNLIVEDEEESLEEDDDEIDEGIEEDDGEGWITPSNIKEVKKQMGLVDTEQADVIVGCLTTDFAMQNVLIQMGLNVISVDGMLIKKAKSYVLRCFACFKITTKMEKLFCPHCGNHTLKRIAMAVNEDGTVKYFFSRRKQLSTRGLRQSIPTPKGGKHAQNPMLVADQPVAHQRPSRKALQSMDVFDPDFVASESPFSKHDVTSRAAQLGIMRRGQSGGNQKKSGGHRK